jgi:site-specific DNA-cytosine methylase
MNKVAKINRNLPTNLNELTKFVLIGREKLNSVRAEIRAIDKLDLASDVRNQKKEEATLLAGALLDAEAKIGDILRKIPKDTANQYKSATLPQGKIAKAKDMGFSSKQVHQFQQLSENIQIIEQVKAEAIKNDDLPTRTEVLKRIKLSNETKKEVRSEFDIKPSLYGENIYFNSADFIEERWDDHVIKEDKYPTLTRLGRFFHEDMTEFSLREYATVQDFPDSYKFIGTYSDIKGQIGNAVSPKMAEYVGKKLSGKTVIDLFAGCGGLSCGLQNIGKNVIFANEFNIKYFQTYILNHPNTKCSLKNIFDLREEDMPSADIVVGGPPCQGFSLAGLRLKDDPRNKLYREFLRIVEIKKPKEFLMENVPQIQEIKDQIISDFNEIGYDVSFEIIHGHDIGMKQSRKRAFFIGKIKQ